jgi:hypothetical protein
MELPPHVISSATQAAFAMNFYKLDALEAKLVQIFAYMHPKGISEIVLARASKGLVTSSLNLPTTVTEVRVKSSLVQLLAPFMDGNQYWNEHAFRRSMDQLLPLSFIFFDSHSGLYSMTSLHRSFIRATVGDRELMCRCATTLLATSIGSQKTPRNRASGD